MKRNSLRFLSVSRTESLKSMHMLADYGVAAESLAATRLQSAQYSSNARATAMTLWKIFQEAKDALYVAFHSLFLRFFGFVPLFFSTT